MRLLPQPGLLLGGDSCLERGNPSLRSCLEAAPKGLRSSQLWEDGGRAGAMESWHFTKRPTPGGRASEYKSDLGPHSPGPVLPFQDDTVISGTASWSSLISLCCPDRKQAARALHTPTCDTSLSIGSSQAWDVLSHGPGWKRPADPWWLSSAGAFWVSLHNYTSRCTSCVGLPHGSMALQRNLLVLSSLQPWLHYLGLSFYV